MQRGEAWTREFWIRAPCVAALAVVGVGSTRQGEHPGVSQYRLAVDAHKIALADTGLESSAIDGVLGAKLFSSGLTPPCSQGSWL